MRLLILSAVSIIFAPVENLSLIRSSVVKASSLAKFIKADADNPEEP